MSTFLVDNFDLSDWLTSIDNFICFSFCQSKLSDNYSDDWASQNRKFINFRNSKFDIGKSEIEGDNFVPLIFSEYVKFY